MANTILVPEYPTKRKCSVCGKEFDREMILVRDGDLCPECRKTYRGMAYVYCNTCKKCITRVLPGIAENGFVIRGGDMLHVDACPICHPEVKNSVPLEMQDYEKRRGH